MENDSFYCIIEASENVAEQVDEIPNDSTGENSLHTNISGCKEDRMTVSFFFCFNYVVYAK